MGEFMKIWKFSSCTFLLSLSLLSVNSFAMGSSATITPTATPTTDPNNGIVVIGNTIVELNPYVQILQSQFKAATKPITSSTDNTIVVATGNGIQLNETYNCRVYPIFTISSSSNTSNSSASWYEFQLFGGIFLDNEAFMEGGKIKTFASEPQFDNEVWGESQSGTYYEALRLNDNRDLLVEGFSPAATWIQVALQLIGVSPTSGIEQALQSMAISTTVSGIEGFVVSYSYCPNPTAPSGTSTGSVTRR
jgi:hypothetical protein